jgi:hypothetical protein
MLRLDRRVALLDRPLRRRVARERVENGVLEIGGVGVHRRRDVGERRDHQSRLHVEPVEVRGETPQPIDDRVRFEGSVLLGESHERRGVEFDLELVDEGLGERRVQERRSLELHLEVAAVASNGERPKQHRRAVVDAGVLPLGDTDSEVDRIDAPRGGQFEALRRDFAGRELGSAKGDVVADEARQEGALARDELGEAARVRRTELDSRAGRVDEVDQRRWPADRGQFGSPLVPHGLGNIGERVVRIAEGQYMGCGHLLLHAGMVIARLVKEIVLRSISTPHTATLSAQRAKAGEMTGSFATDRGK